MQKKDRENGKGYKLNERRSLRSDGYKRTQKEIIVHRELVFNVTQKSQKAQK
jgi:hypothetical protein